MNVAIFGAGYVGLVTGTVLADIGHHVQLIEVSKDKVSRIMAGLSPIFEEGLESALARVRAKDQLRATVDPAQGLQSAKVVFIAVGTPPGPHGEPELSQVEAAARAIGQHLIVGGQTVVVNKATVPIGSAHLVSIWIEEGFREKHPGERLPDFSVASNPEFLREGSAIFDTLYPDRIVLGSDEGWVLDTLSALYRPIIEQSFTPPPEFARPSGHHEVPVVMVDAVSSEMIKYAANAFLATKISFANEIANICERVGADAMAVMAGIGLDTRIGSRFLNPGAGWGGSCFGKDLASLTFTAREYGYQPKLLEATVNVNVAQRLLIVKRVQEILRPVKGRRVAIWGLAFKPGTDDIRDAPSLTVMEELLRMGMRITAYDPVAMPTVQRMRPDLPIQYGVTPESALEGAEALIVVTEWPEFEHVDYAQIRKGLLRPVIIDGRNVLNEEKARENGLLYYGIGRRGTADDWVMGRGL